MLQQRYSNSKCVSGRKREWVCKFGYYSITTSQGIKRIPHTDLGLAQLKNGIDPKQVSLNLDRKSLSKHY